MLFSLLQSHSEQLCSGLAALPGNTCSCGLSSVFLSDYQSLGMMTVVHCFRFRLRFSWDQGSGPHKGRVTSMYIVTATQMWVVVSGLEPTSQSSIPQATGQPTEKEGDAEKDKHQKETLFLGRNRIENQIKSK